MSLQHQKNELPKTLTKFYGEQERPFRNGKFAEHQERVLDYAGQNSKVQAKD